MNLDYQNCVVGSSKHDLRPGQDELHVLLASSARPFVIAGERELSVLRRGLTKDGWKRSLYLQDEPKNNYPLSGAGLLARANRALEKDVFLDIERHEHFRLSNDCLALAIIYQIDRDIVYAAKAAEILGCYGSIHMDGVMSACEEAVWIIPLAQAYDLIFHSKSISPPRRDAIENKLFRQAAKRLSQNDGKGSGGAKCTAALGVIGCSLKDAELLRTALDRYFTQMNEELGEDGLWPESIYNHYLVLRSFVHLAEACSRMGLDLYSLKSRKSRNLKAMFLAPLSFVYPSYRIPAIHEGPGEASVPLDLYEIAFRRWGELSFAWVLKSGYQLFKRAAGASCEKYKPEAARNGLYAFLFGRDLPLRVPELQISSKDSPSLALCSLTNDSAVLTFDHGDNFGNKHLDRLGITFYSNGRLLCRDYGTPDPDEEKAFFYTSTSAHNTIMVDGRHQEETDESGLQAFYSGVVLQMAEAVSEKAYPGVKHARRVFLLGDIVVIEDTVDSSLEHIYDCLFHCEGSLSCPSGKSFRSVDTLEYFTDAREYDKDTAHTVRWEVNDFGFAEVFFTDSPCSLISASYPADASEKKAHAVILRKHGRSAELTSLLIPFREEPPVVKRAGKLVTIDRGRKRSWLYAAGLSEKDKTGQEDFETDALIAIVSEKDGEFESFGLFGGSYIKLRGEYILQGAGRFDRIEVCMNSRYPVISFDGAVGGSLRLKSCSRAMRVNGHRISAATIDGMAIIKLAGVLAGRQGIL